EKHSKLGAFWHTEFGPLNQVIHVYPYADLQQRTAVRAALAQDTERQRLPGGGDLVVEQEAEMMNPAPFMHPLGSRDYGTGNVYEMRTYTYGSGDSERGRGGGSKPWEAGKKSPPRAPCWTSERGGQKNSAHIGLYKDLHDRPGGRGAPRQSGGAWPPQTGVRPIRQANKLL